MAIRLMVEGVYAGSSPLMLSSLFPRPELSVPPCRCNRHCERPPTDTIRCASSSSLIDRLDPPLPRLPSYQESIPGSRVPRYRVILEQNPNWDHGYPLRSQEPPFLEPWNNLEQPSSPGDRDSSNKFTSYIDGQERDVRRRSESASPSYMSVSRSRRAMANRATLQVVSAPFRSKDLKGPSGFYVGFAAIMIGLMAVLQKGGLLGINTPPTTVCSKCEGYGTRPCRLCKGRGSITWEGKLKHTDLCPSCFGARIKKCSDCGGYRMRNDEPPFLQQMSFKSRP